MLSHGQSTISYTSVDKYVSYAKVKLVSQDREFRNLDALCLADCTVYFPLYVGACTTRGFFDVQELLYSEAPAIGEVYECYTILPLREPHPAVWLTNIVPLWNRLQSRIHARPMLFTSELFVVVGVETVVVSA